MKDRRELQQIIGNIFCSSLYMHIYHKTFRHDCVNGLQMSTNRSHSRNCYHFDDKNHIVRLIQTSTLHTHDELYLPLRQFINRQLLSHICISKKKFRDNIKIRPPAEIISKHCVAKRTADLQDNSIELWENRITIYTYSFIQDSDEFIPKKEQHFCFVRLTILPLLAVMPSKYIHISYIQ